MIYRSTSSLYYNFYYLLIFSNIYRLIRRITSSNGLQCVNLFSANGFTSESFIRAVSRSSFSWNDTGKIKSASLSGDGNCLSYQISGKNVCHSSFSAGIEIQPDSIAMETLSAENTPTCYVFPDDSDEFDLDYPTVGFSSIPEAVEDIRQGKVGRLLFCYYAVKHSKEFL